MKFILRRSTLSKIIGYGLQLTTEYIATKCQYSCEKIVYNFQIILFFQKSLPPQAANLQKFFCNFIHAIERSSNTTINLNVSKMGFLLELCLYSFIIFWIHTVFSTFFFFFFGKFVILQKFADISALQLWFFFITIWKL